MKNKVPGARAARPLRPSLRAMIKLTVFYPVITSRDSRSRNEVNQEKQQFSKNTCHPRVGGDPEKTLLDSRLRGNDNIPGLPRRFAPRNDGLRVLCSFILIYFFASFSVAQASDTYSFDSPVLQTRFEHITQELRCLVCQNESLAESNAPLAKDLRNEVYTKIKSGESDAEIKQYLVDRYGQFVLFKPAFNYETYALWMLPFLILIAGFLVIFLLSRRRK